MLDANGQVRRNPKNSSMDRVCCRESFWGQEICVSNHQINMMDMKERLVICRSGLGHPARPRTPWDICAIWITSETKAGCRAGLWGGFRVVFCRCLLGILMVWGEFHGVNSMGLNALISV